MTQINQATPTQPHFHQPAATLGPAELQKSSLPPLPLLASTHFCMEILLRSSVLDLRSLTEVLAFDPCALLRLFAQTGKEYPQEDRPERLEECIIALGSTGLLRALHYAPSTWEQQARLSAFADHGVAVGRCAQTLAAPLGLCQQTAWTLGLLHAVGHLPRDLGWAIPPGLERNTAAVTAHLAEQHRLSFTLTQALVLIGESNHHEGGQEFIWPALIRAAHDVAEGEHRRCPFD